METRLIVIVRLDAAFTCIEYWFNASEFWPIKVNHPPLKLLHCGQVYFISILYNIVALMPIHVNTPSDHSVTPTEFNKPATGSSLTDWMFGHNTQVRKNCRLECTL
jgi:hypothetical protein